MRIVCAPFVLVFASVCVCVCCSGDARVSARLREREIVHIRDCIRDRQHGLIAILFAQTLHIGFSEV